VEFDVHRSAFEVQRSPLTWVLDVQRSLSLRAPRLRGEIRIRTDRSSPRRHEEHGDRSKETLFLLSDLCVSVVNAWRRGISLRALR
jgi:hypothetical protein